MTAYTTADGLHVVVVRLDDSVPTVVHHGDMHIVRTLALGDVDGNGLLDIVIGTFADPALLSGLLSQEEMVVADFNADSYADVASATQLGAAVLLSQAAPRFVTQTRRLSTEPDAPMSLWGSGWQAPAFLDAFGAGTAWQTADVVVVRESVDWLRADAVVASLDPSAASPHASSVLPLIPRADGTWRDVIVPNFTQTFIERAPDDDLTNGTGPRFVVDTTDEPVIHVLTDQTGIFRAFIRFVD